MMVGKVRKLANPHRAKAKKKNKSTARRKMSAKQIRHFGTKRQRNSLKRRTSKANPRKRVAKRKNARKATKRTAKPQVIVIRNPAPKRRKRAATKRRARRNPLHMVTLGLVNPRKRRNSVAKTKRRSKARKTAHNPKRKRRMVALGRRANPRRTRRHARKNGRRYGHRNPAIFGVTGAKGMGELVLGGLAGVAVGKAIPGFLPAVFVGNPLFQAVSVAGVGYFIGMALTKFLGSSVIGDSFAFGTVMEAGGTLISAYVPGLGLGAFVPGAFNEPDNPVRAGNMRLQIAAAAAQQKAGMGNFAHAYAPAY